jgi:hypothetical protein
LTSGIRNAERIGIARRNADDKGRRLDDSRGKEERAVVDLGKTNFKKRVLSVKIPELERDVVGKIPVKISCSF